MLYRINKIQFKQSPIQGLKVRRLYTVEITIKDTGRISVHRFKGEGAAQQAFNCANRNVFKLGNSVLMNTETENYE